MGYTFVSVMNNKGTEASIYSTFGIITIFVFAIGGISISIGEVSIFKIMMMSVSERLEQNGIMRCIGIQKNEVLGRFIHVAGNT